MSFSVKISIWLDLFCQKSGARASLEVGYFKSFCDNDRNFEIKRKTELRSLFQISTSGAWKFSQSAECERK